MSTQDTEDRREYYRIDDQIALQIRLPGSQNEEDSLLFNLLGDLHLLEYERNRSYVQWVRPTVLYPAT